MNNIFFYVEKMSSGVFHMKKLVFLMVFFVLLGTITTPSLYAGSFSFKLNSDDCEELGSPPHPVRQPAEFEPMEGVLIRYPFGISYEIIAEMAEDVNVVTIVASQDEANYVESQYSSHGVNTAHTSYLIAPSDSYWTRDYGPWFVFDGDNNLSVIDFTYNRPRPNDNNIPSAFAADQNMSLYYMPLTHTGGNYMTDGQGIAVSTDLVYTENPDKTAEEINGIVNDYLGITKYHVVTDALGEYIKHIDCWAKYLAPDVIMIIKVSKDHPSYDKIEAAVKYFENQTSCYGTPYKIERVYCDMDEPYINSLILNNKVFVPVTGSSWDDDALESYEEAMPGYEVIGFSGSWYNTDALHCRAKGIPDRGMLYIEHTPLSGAQNGADGFTINAKIYSYSGGNLVLSATRVYYQVDHGQWESVQMNSLGNNYYKAVIPSQPDGSTISYYIHAEDESGRKENHPYIGAAWPHTFTVINPNMPSRPAKPGGPSEGIVEEVYTYHTNTTDPNGDNVQYGWDWDGDDIVDEWTGFYESGETINTSHSWSQPGIYPVKVKAKDDKGVESSFSPVLGVTITENNPPLTPNNPNPVNNSENISVSVTLSWTGGDPDPDDDVVYDVYLGTNSSPKKIAGNLTDTSYIPGPLNYETCYYWRVIARDNHDAVTTGPIWKFTTEGEKDHVPPSIEVTRPTPGLYLMNKKIMGLTSTTLIFFKIDVVVNASDKKSGINHVDFYVNDDKKFSDNLPPYKWTWAELTFGMRTIKAIAFDNAGNSAEKNITVWKFL